MPTLPTAETTAAAASVAETKAAPKAKKAPAAKATPKAATPKAAPAPKTEPGLRKPQIRILAALAKTSKPLNRNQIAEKASADLAWLNSWIGSNDEATRAKNDKKFPCLLTLKFVKFAAFEDEKGVAYEITASGRKALEDAKKVG
jgi:hypothetical protein